MYKRTLKKTLMVQALSAALGATALTAVVSTTAWAQSNTVGTVFGNVAAPSGVTIAVENVGTGARRTANPDASGRYLVTSLPPGIYKVMAMRGAAVIDTKRVEVLAGSGSEVDFTGTQSVEAVSVTARRTTIDVSNSANGTTFTAKELDKLPITPNLAAIIQLAPNTTKADARYAGGAVFAGGAPSENAFYINGFPVTNPLSQLGSSELPFGAIAQAQILVGGFGAEFGRSIGGVVNITTKTGTNEWEYGVSTSITPNTLRSKAKDSYFPASTGNTTDGTLLRRNNDNYVQTERAGGYIGGPLVKDKLFAFVSYEQTRNNTRRVVNSTLVGSPAGDSTNGFADDVNLTQRYMAKFDWNINDSNHVEATLIGDKPTQHEKLYGYNYATRATTPVVASDAVYQNIDNSTSIGANAQIFKYTGNWIENLTVTALYGKSLAKHINRYAGYDINSQLPQLQFATATARAPGIVYPQVQPLTGLILPAGAEDKVKSVRFDVEYAWRSHTVRAGLDDNKLQSKNAGDFTAGQTITQFRFAADPNALTNTGFGRFSPASAGGLGLLGYFAREQRFSDVTNADSNQKAQYIEDRWQVTKNLLVTPGLRTEQYENLNGDREVFLKIKQQYNPRLAAVWDMNGDSSTKVFGSLGRYSIQIPTHIAVRGASRSLFTRQFFTYTGIDPATGNPIGRVNFGVSAANPNGVAPFSANNEYNQAKVAQEVSAQDLKPSYQDEITLGFERALSPSYNFGFKGTYRTLKQTIDDFCDQTPFDDYAARKGIDTSNWGGFGCASINPGINNRFRVNYKGTTLASDYQDVVLTPGDIGFPEKPKRTYAALDFRVEHPLRNGWYGTINYTLSRSKGNTEGQTLSDVAQTDVAATQTWDFAAIMIGANGRLPGDRTHQIKAFGYMQVASDWTLGGNFLAASGRPKNCLGNFDSTVKEFQGPKYYDLGYGSSFHVCNGKFSPRGTDGNLPWDVSVDANVVYAPGFFKGLSFRADVLNLFNRQVAQVIDEQRNVAGSGTVIQSNTYGRVISYTAPRIFRFTAEYKFN